MKIANVFRICNRLSRSTWHLLWSEERANRECTLQDTLVWMWRGKRSIMGEVNHILIAACPRTHASCLYICTCNPKLYICTYVTTKISKKWDLTVTIWINNIFFGFLHVLILNRHENNGLIRVLIVFFPITSSRVNIY
jgi:hypothetical protein